MSSSTAVAVCTRRCCCRAAFDWVVAERLIHHADPFPFIIVNGAKRQRRNRLESACLRVTVLLCSMLRSVYMCVSLLCASVCGMMMEMAL